MPNTKLYSILIVLPIVFQSSSAGRRITSGNAVTSNNRFMVYLLSSSTAPRQYSGWMCGGAIISKDYVITSAACVQDVLHMYVISGYNKYVASDQMESDHCVKEKKKKVILTCVPREYQLDYNKTEVWARIDIAVVKVESPFDFDDATYETVCSYKPSPIEFNLEKEFPKTGDDVLILGWGHNDMWRKNEDTHDYNQKILQYAGTRILDENECVKYYVRNKKMASIIRASMLCTLESGNLNDQGELISRTLPGKGCLPGKNKLTMIDKGCEKRVELYAEKNDGEINYEELAGAQIIDLDEYDMRRQEESVENPVTQSAVNASSNAPVSDEDYSYQISNENRTSDISKEDNEKRPGICQNDHGGPLIAWRGGKEILVGIATLFKLNQKNQCRGPFLFTKTWCNGVFLNCILDQSTNETGTRRMCEDPTRVGFEIIRRHISWVGHRDGPADNERIQMRHQVPLSAFQPGKQ